MGQYIIGLLYGLKDCGIAWDNLQQKLKNSRPAFEGRPSSLENKLY